MNLETMTDVAQLRGHDGPVSGCAWTRGVRRGDDDGGDGDGGEEDDDAARPSTAARRDKIVSCGWDGTLRLWEVHVDEWTKSVLEVVQVGQVAVVPSGSVGGGAPPRLRALALSRCGTAAAVGVGAALQLFDLKNSMARWTCADAHIGDVLDLDFAARCAHSQPAVAAADDAAEAGLQTEGATAGVVASCGRDGSVHVWCCTDAAEAELALVRVPDEKGARGPLNACAASSCGSYAATASAHGEVNVWRVGAALELAPHASTRSTLVRCDPAAHPCSRAVFKGALTPTVTSLRCACSYCAPVAQAAAGRGEAWCLAFSPDSALLAVGYDDSTVGLLDLCAGGELCEAGLQPYAPSIQPRGVPTHRPRCPQKACFLWKEIL